MAQNVIDFVDAEECGKLNADRLLGGKHIAAIVRGANGEITGKVPKCFICQAQGHWKQDCTVDKNKLYCTHCKTRKHNTSKFCPVYKKKNKDNPKEGDTKPKTKKKGKARVLKETGKDDEEQEEDDEDDDSDDLLLYGCRLQWWPLGDDTDGDLDTSSEPEVLYLDSEDETED